LCNLTGIVGALPIPCAFSIGAAKGCRHRIAQMADSTGRPISSRGRSEVTAVSSARARASNAQCGASGAAPSAASVRMWAIGGISGRAERADHARTLSLKPGRFARSRQGSASEFSYPRVHQHFAESCAEHCCLSKQKTVSAIAAVDSKAPSAPPIDLHCHISVVPGSLAIRNVSAELDLRCWTTPEV
jgi:hypothetical protein